METSSTSLQLNYVSSRCLRPHTIRTERLNKSLKQEMVARINPFRALYRCDSRLLQESSIRVHSHAANMDCATWGLYLQQMFPLLRQAIALALVLVHVLVIVHTPRSLVSLRGEMWCACVPLCHPFSSSFLGCMYLSLPPLLAHRF